VRTFEALRRPEQLSLSNLWALGLVLLMFGGSMVEASNSAALSFVLAALGVAVLEVAIIATGVTYGMRFHREESARRDGA